MYQELHQQQTLQHTCRYIAGLPLPGRAGESAWDTNISACLRFDQIELRLETSPGSAWNQANRRLSGGGVPGVFFPFLLDFSI